MPMASKDMFIRFFGIIEPTAYFAHTSSIFRTMVLLRTVGVCLRIITHSVFSLPNRLTCRLFLVQVPIPRSCGECSTNFHGCVSLYMKDKRKLLLIGYRAINHHIIHYRGVPCSPYSYYKPWT